MNIEKRNTSIDIVLGKYKAISAYKIPSDIDFWLECKNCKLIPLTWEFNNGRSTACGCGENEYNHFSIYSESIMSHISRNNGSAIDYDSDKLRKNWNHWVTTNEILEDKKELLKQGKW
jgi:hypothetical protein